MTDLKINQLSLSHVPSPKDQNYTRNQPERLSEEKGGQKQQYLR